MKPMFKGLDTETQLLVAIGSAVAAGCIPCLENIAAKARAEGVDAKKMKAAAIVGQFIKDQPAGHMKAASDRLLGTHLGAGGAAGGCPMDAPENVSTGVVGGARDGGCGCR